MQFLDPSLYVARRWILWGRSVDRNEKVGKPIRATHTVQDLGDELCVARHARADPDERRFILEHTGGISELDCAVAVEKLSHQCPDRSLRREGAPLTGDVNVEAAQLVATRRSADDARIRDESVLLLAIGGGHERPGRLGQQA